MIDHKYCWYALKTNYQAEMKCIDFLTDNGIECFTPWEYSFRKWTDRIKRIEVPRFSQYIFAEVSCIELPIINCCKPHVGIVKRGNRPDPIPPKVVCSLQSIGNDSGLYQFQDIPVRKGQQVLIIDGPFIGQMADLHGLNGSKKAIVRIGSTGLSVSIPER